MNNADERLGMGWLPDYPDFRDYTEGHEEVRKMGRRLRCESEDLKRG